MTAVPSANPHITPEDFTRLQDMLEGSRILVTGGTGSFGRAFIARVLELFNPAKVIVFSRDEMKQSEMAEMAPFCDDPRLGMFIGDVRDEGRLVMAFRGVDYIIHAAALKQVPAAEYNPFECIHTNVLGAENVVRASIQNSVKRVIALSTDKAANAANLYGASKFASDKIFVAGNHLSGASRTRFSVVRYGNVLGSRGSILPLFRRLIARNADSLPITDPRMTRFCITLQHGVDFVLSSLAMMRGGEVFVPKIPSFRVTDLAQALAPGLPQRMVGIRPGEKLHEVMVTEDNSRNTVEFPSQYVIEPALAWWERHSYKQDGVAGVADGFRYSSDANADWLGPEELKALIAAHCP